MNRKTTELMREANSPPTWRLTFDYSDETLVAYLSPEEVTQFDSRPPRPTPR